MRTVSRRVCVSSLFSSSRRSVSSGVGGSGFSGNVIIDESDGASLVRETAAGEWGTVDTYTVKLAVPVAVGTKIYVTISAARSITFIANITFASMARSLRS